MYQNRILSSVSTILGSKWVKRSLAEDLLPLTKKLKTEINI